MESTWEGGGRHAGKPNGAQSASPWCNVQRNCMFCMYLDSKAVARSLLHFIKQHIKKGIQQSSIKPRWALWFLEVLELNGLWTWAQKKHRHQQHLWSQGGGGPLLLFVDSWLEPYALWHQVLHSSKKNHCTFGREKCWLCLIVTDEQTACFGEHI